MGEKEGREERREGGRVGATHGGRERGVEISKQKWNFLETGQLHPKMSALIQRFL